MSQTETSFFLAERQVSVRGYNSVSEMYSFGKELGRLIRDGVYPVILYLGDHDPSGINMPLVAARDLTMYAGAEVEVVRLALNLDQVTARMIAKSLTPKPGIREICRFPDRSHLS